MRRDGKIIENFANIRKICNFAGYPYYDMEFDKRYAIACKGVGDGLCDYVFDVGDSFFESCPDGEISGGRCRVSVSARRTGSTIVLSTAIEGSVSVTCDRCLEQCEVPVSFDGVLTVRLSDVGESYDGEVMNVPASSDDIDLGQYIYESIVLSLPYRRVHAEGSCNPDMLSRFTVATAEEFDRMEAEVERKQMHGLAVEDFDKLAALKQRMESGTE